MHEAMRLAANPATVNLARAVVVGKKIHMSYWVSAEHTSQGPRPDLECLAVCDNIGSKAKLAVTTNRSLVTCGRCLRIMRDV